MKERLSKVHQIEYDLNNIVNTLVDEYDIPSDFYGDHWPEEIETLVTYMSVSKNEEDYQLHLNEAEELLTYWAKDYLQHEEQEELE